MTYMTDVSKLALVDKGALEELLRLSKGPAIKEDEEAAEAWQQAVEKLYEGLSDPAMGAEASYDEITDSDAVEVVTSRYLKAFAEYEIGLSRRYKAPIEAGPLVTCLLHEDVLFFNTNWSREDWSEEARKTWRILVNCNDVFAWACADAEEIMMHEVRDLFDHWCQDPIWGSSVWCIKRRGIMPQEPVERRIRDAGFWDLDNMDLAPNPYERATK